MIHDPRVQRDEAVRSFLDQLGRATETTGVRVDPHDGALYHHEHLVGFLERRGGGYVMSVYPSGHLVTREPHRAARPRAGTVT